MRRVWAAGSAMAMCLLVGSPVAAQQAMVRGQVTDESGQPLTDVKVLMECMEDNRPRRFNRITDKKGGYVQVGLPGGVCKMSFSKPGYQPRNVDAHITLGGLSELPAVTLKAAPAPAQPSGGGGGTAAASAPGAGPAGAGPDASERIKHAFATANEAIKAGRLDEAEALYKGVLETAPQAAAAHFNLGVIYRQKKDWTSAEAAFRKVMEIEPEKSDAYAALAGVYELSGNSARALELLAEAAPRFEQDARFQYQLGITSLNASQPDRAVAALAKAGELDPSNAEVHFWLATVAVGKNSVPEAIGYLEKYLELAGPSAPNLTAAQNLLKTLKQAKP